ncbi:hypothetical protein O6H91_14G064100 [Diphasiastrum complanatum]|uniref:Uncharacterized protein n=1 Tax=Diphasiastrum complanatum TaxID=34168 RepID=A0ACC2BQ46_DIPCM|nr:hypothetical protein O6H91_14G064100 [Diphasiastrum complanatum]
MAAEVEPDIHTQDKARKRRSSSHSTTSDKEEKDPNGPEKHSPASGSKEEKVEDLGSGASVNAFVFWAYFVGFVSVLTLALAIISNLGSLDEKGEFLAMPLAVRQHFSKGRMIKVEMGARRQPMKVFVRAEGPLEGEAILMIHGIGGSSFLYRKVIPLLAAHGHYAIAVDLPGSGLSEKSILREVDDAELGLMEAFVGRCRQVYEEIAEKGLFWRLEELFETGALPEVLPFKNKLDLKQRPISWDTEGLSEVLKQVLDSFGISAVHLVAHDTGLTIGHTFASRYPSQLRSITIVDALPHKASFPLSILSIPGIGFVLSRPSFLYRILLQACCVRNLSPSEAEAHGFLLRRGNGRQSMLEMARTFNHCADLSSSATKKVLNEIPLQILWASSWSNEWVEDGKQLSAHFPNASSVSHLGSRWPQEDVAEEIFEVIDKFVSSLGRTVRPSTKEEFPEHIQRMFDEMASSGGNLESHSHGHEHQHDHSHQHHDHDHRDHDHNHHDPHDHGAAYMGGHGMNIGGWAV